MTQAHHNPSEKPPHLLRPRLWVPGLVCVTESGDVQLGRSAGYGSSDPAFAKLRLGQTGSISNWTHSAWVVSRSALTAEIMSDHAIVLPESLVDEEAQHHANRWLREQPLVCVSGATYSRLADAGVRVFRVAFNATGDRVLDVEGVGRDLPPVSLGVALDPLEQAVNDAGRHLSLWDQPGDPSPIDRLLRFVSHGVLDELAVLNAFHARCLIEDGYGYRGALEGRFVTLERIAEQLEPLNVLFSQIFSRASTMRRYAEGLLTAVSRAAPEVAEVAVPVYDRARRVVVPGVRLAQVERFILGGASHHDLDLPRARRWSVDRVDPWTPHLPAHLKRPRDADDEPKHAAARARGASAEDGPHGDGPETARRDA